MRCRRRSTETRPEIRRASPSLSSATAIPMRARECRMARASAIPPSPGAPRTPSSTTGLAVRATPSSAAGGSRAAAIRRAARAAMAARCGAVSSSRAASSSGSSKRSAVSPSGVTSVHLSLPETTATCPARTMLPRPPARVLAGTSRTCSASTTSSASAADWSGGRPAMGGTRMLPQAMSPGADHAFVLFSAGWKGLGRSPQAASAPHKTKTSAHANAHRRRAAAMLARSIMEATPSRRSSPSARRTGARQR